LPPTEKNDKPRAIRIVWNYEVVGPDRTLSLKPVIRRSPNYLELARYFLKHPPIGKGGAFRPGALPGKLVAVLQTYRHDVETWVAMEMCSAITQDPQHDDDALFKQVLRKLHHKEWDDDVAERGFYLVQPAPLYGLSKVKGKDTEWQLRVLGKDSMPDIEAKGIGWWREPEPDEYEGWQTRIAFIHLRSMATACAEAAITGRPLGALNTEGILRLVETAALTAKKALPPAKSDEEDEKDE